MILKLFGISSVEVATNNPRKVFGLKQHGVEVTRRVGLVASPNPHNEHYLSTKATRAGHILPFGS